MNITRTATRALRAGNSAFPPITRCLSITATKLRDGDTGAIRPGGDRTGDSWSRREKAAEDLYIRGREKAILQLLKEKIIKQEEALAKDRAMLSAMEDQYGQLEQERTHV